MGRRWQRGWEAAWRDGRAAPNQNDAVVLLRAATKCAPHVRLVCEATAGYEQLLATASFKAGVPICIVPPQRPRHFAKALGLHAKNDPVDAALLSRFGNQTGPQPAMPKERSRKELESLMRARGELIDALGRENSRHEHHAHPVVLKLAKARIARLEKDIAAIDKAAAAVIAADPLLSKADALLRQVTGVSHQSSRVLLAFMPELGTLNRREIAALAGLAPFDRDSGNKQGKRFIQGGRARIRSTLHMAGLSAAKFNKVLAPAYRKLRKAGKPFKVAITAITRKLLVHLNSIMADFLKNEVAA
ncbi:transposase [Luteolibacter flavescens]|uniref:Transposase n=1 Tax=Luteolibacter flavescens TaxID=1859460 RepID=A0ABT3FSE0_9BACT|nr:transposase [Luteolibacter flavescens]MCW1886229.1 transposase [Luteolibacter flavescens]